MNPIRTPRLLLVPATAELALAEWRHRLRFFAMLGVPERGDWPSEDLREILPAVVEELREHPDHAGWLPWYWIRRTSKGDSLVGGGGFKGPPGEDGVVEIGYETCAEQRGHGFAVEAVSALVEWALAHEIVTCVCGEAHEDNAASRAVLRRVGFIEIGEGAEPELLRYERQRKA